MEKIKKTYLAVAVINALILGVNLFFVIKNPINGCQDCRSDLFFNLLGVAISVAISIIAFAMLLSGKNKVEKMPTGLIFFLILLPILQYFIVSFGTMIKIYSLTFGGF